MRSLLAAVLSLQVMASVPLASVANAEDVLPVTWRKAQFLSLEGEASSIVIGDPSVVDVTIEGGGQVVLFGKQPGETNMMIMGSDGTVLLNAAVVVAPETARHVSIISPVETSISERSWNCYNRCVQVIGPGGIQYKPVRAIGGGGAAAGMAPGGEAGGEQTAEGVGTMNKDAGAGASAVGDQSGTLVTP